MLNLNLFKWDGVYLLIRLFDIELIEARNGPYIGGSGATEEPFGRRDLFKSWQSKAIASISQAEVTGKIRGGAGSTNICFWQLQFSPYNFPIYFLRRWKEN